MKQEIDYLIAAVGQGVNREHVVARVIDLQDQIKAIDKCLQAEPLVLPPDDVVRVELFCLPARLDCSVTDPRSMRLLFECVLDHVILTPIPGKAHGETVQVVLRAAPDWGKIWKKLVLTSAAK